MFYLGHGPFSHLFEKVKQEIRGDQQVIFLFNIINVIFTW